MANETKDVAFNPLVPMRRMPLSVSSLTKILHEALEQGRQLGMRRPKWNEYIHDLPVPLHDAAPPGLGEITSLTQILLAAAETRFEQAWNLKVAAELEDCLEEVLLDGIRMGATVTSPLVEDRSAPHGHDVVQSYLRRLIPSLIKAGQAIYGAEELMSEEPPVSMELYSSRTEDGVTVRSGWMLDPRKGGRYQLRLQVTNEAARISTRRCGARDFIERGEIKPGELRVVLQMIAEALAVPIGT